MRILIFISGLLLITVVTLYTFSVPRIQITREYVSNSKWGKCNNSKNTADISIKRIILVDTSHVFSEKCKIENIANNYIIDSTFCYRLYYTDNCKIKKIYFDREQKDILWIKECSTNLSQKIKTIGKLNLNAWYKLGSIRHNYVYFIYIDEKDKTHIYKAFIAKNW